MFKDLEQQYNFAYPKLYHQLYADQMLDIGEYSSFWSKEVYPRLKNRPPLFLYSGEFELIPPANIAETIEELNGEDSWFSINPDYLIIVSSMIKIILNQNRPLLYCTTIRMRQKYWLTP